MLAQSARRALRGGSFLLHNNAAAARDSSLGVLVAARSSSLFLSRRHKSTRQEQQKHKPGAWVSDVSMCVTGRSRSPTAKSLDRKQAPNMKPLLKSQL
jgi:hypothetical protein